MSSLQVLALGHNPSILLYTSRFQLANSVELYHISDSESSTFEIETAAYGTETLSLQRHYRSIDQLTSHRKKDSSLANSPLYFDIVILAAPSLQQLAAIATGLTEYINSSTKVFVESTGFVQLESFVKMSMNVSHLNIFSVLNDFDIREVAPNKYKQFAPGAANTIYLGDASVKPSGTGSKTQEYDAPVLTLLKTFDRLFQKLFPRDTVSLCGSNPRRFLAQQWTAALPVICFDPLLILLEETQPQLLKDQILAKPLVSGLLAEVLRITKAMAVELPRATEQEWLDQWSGKYKGDRAMPPLLYHFLQRTAPLNFDVSLLQAILLADDYNLKTPYLEFLYSTMVQLQKLNDGKSKWFVRQEGETRADTKVVAQLQSEKSRDSATIAQLQSDLAANKTTLARSEEKAHSAQAAETALVAQLDAARSKMAQLEADNARYITEMKARPVAQAKSKGPLQEIAQEDQGHNTTGTPLMHDLQDFAGYGVNYCESPAQSQGQSQTHSQNQSQHSVEHLEPTAHSHRSNGSSSDTSLKERELDLRKKELELQERELEIQRRAMQMQMQRFPPQQQGGANMNAPQQQYNASQQQYHTASRKSSVANMQQQQQQQQQQQSNNFPRSSRMLHGASAPTMTVSAGEFVDPIAGGVTYPNNGFNNYQGQPNGNVQHQHGFKPTSRKNRVSNMPMLGNASSAPSSSNAYNKYSRPNTGNAAQQNMAQSRMGSASGQGMMMNQNRSRQGQNPSPYNANPRNASNGGMNSSSMASLQQRQTSSASVANGADPNTTSNTVIHTMQSQSTNNLNGMKQTYAPVQLSESTPNISAANTGNGAAVQPNGSSIQPPSMPGTPDMASSQDQVSTAGSEKDGKKKKKKFSLFKKKNKN